MAFVVTILAIDTDNPRVLWSAEAAPEFLSPPDDRLRRLDQNAGYLDYGAILHRAEMLAGAEAYCRRIQQSGVSDWVRNYGIPRLKEAQALLAQVKATPKSDHVLFFVRHWETYAEDPCD